MKLHHQQFTRSLWDETTSLSLSCKRLRPLAPKFPAGGNDVVPSTTATATTIDLKSFIRPDSGPRKLAPIPSSDTKKDPLQVETTMHPGGTRWNPTQEQIGILEALYCRGMRTPNAQQIEQITAQLSKYGKIEGKNVFYWFQNHKARERQKLKRSLTHSPKTTTTSFPTTHDVFDSSSITLSFDSTKEESRREEQTAPIKRKCKSWTFENFIEESIRAPNMNMLANYLNHRTEGEEEDGVKKITLELFPLHPETR